MSTGAEASNKLTIALRNYLAQYSSTALSGYSFFRGIRAGLLTMPSVAVHVAEREPEDMHEESRRWLLKAMVVVRTRCDFDTSHEADTAEDAHRAAVTAVEEAMASSLVQAFVNSENTTISTAATGGTFTLTDTAESQTTAACAYNITATALQVAIQAALTEFNALSVTGSTGGPFTLDSNENSPYPYLTAAGSLTPSGCVADLRVIRPGTASQSPRWRLALGIPARGVQAFHLSRFAQSRGSSALSAERNAFEDVLHFDFAVMNDDGDQGYPPGV